MKKGISIFCIFIITLWLSACNDIGKTKIITRATISPLTEKEFQALDPTLLKNTKKADLRKFVLYTTVVHKRKETVDITFPEHEHLKQAINSIDSRSRYWFGKFYNKDHENERDSYYYDEVIFYAKGLTDDEIRDAFEPFFVHVVVEEETIIKDETFYVQKLIEFK